MLVMFSLNFTRWGQSEARLSLLGDAGANILGIPWWVWLLGGIALAAIAALVAPELFVFAPELGEELAAELAATAEAESPGVYVLGHGGEQLAYEGLDGFSVLNVPDWSLELNDAWIQEAIDQHASILLSSPLNSETIVGSAEYGYETVYAREVSQLLNAGYSFFVDSAGNMLLVSP